MNFAHNIETRKNSLKKLLTNVINYEDEIIKALYDDFKKPAFESVATETSYIISDLKDTIATIDKYVKPQKVTFNLLNFPSNDYIISESFDKNHVSVEQGGQEKSTELLSQRWDYIFFTGSVAVGKIVAKAAALNLTPVTLELGGKSPCIVDQTAKMALTAKRIVWGKFINAGQTCIAPDFILVHQSVKANLLSELKNEIIKAYGNDIKNSPDLARIINLKNWERLVGYIQSDKVIFGGETEKEALFIAPTLIDEPELKSDVMQNEIFGPLLPIISYQNENELKAIIEGYEKPLSLYVFTERTDFANKIMNQFSFGGGCINDTIMHIANKRLPFGGVGHSGMGAYHGKYSFDTFSHKKSISKKGTWLDVPLRYAPYKDKVTTLRKLFKWL